MTPTELRKLATDKFNEARALAKIAEERALTEEESKKANALADEVKSLLERAQSLERADALAAHLAGSEGRVSNPLPHQVETRQPYRLLRALDAAIEGRKIDGLEGEVSAEIAKRTGKNPKGFYLPMDLAIGVKSVRAFRPAESEYRTGTLDTTTGVGAIMTETSASWIEYLRAKVVCSLAGAQTLGDIQGNFAIPRQTAGATFSWVVNGAAPSASNATIDQVVFSPKTLTGYTDITRSLTKQTSFDAEMFARRDIADGLAVSLDKAGLSGSGSGAEPLGIVNNSSLATVALGTDGAAPTWAMIVGLETNVAAGNADLGSLAYITNAKARGKLKQTPKIGTTFPEFIWKEGMVNDYRAFATNQVSSTLSKGGTSNALSAMVFGNFADLVFALWGGVDILVNPYFGNAGSVRLNIFQDADIQIRHTESFSRCVDIVTT